MECDGDDCAGCGDACGDGESQIMDKMPMMTLLKNVCISSVFVRLLNFFCICICICVSVEKCSYLYLCAKADNKVGKWMAAQMVVGFEF